MADTFAKELRHAIPNIAMQEQADMRDYTTFRIGGPAELLVTPTTTAQLLTTVQLATDMGEPLFILGNGSNVLVSDAGIRGVVIHTAALSEVDVQDETITAQCGAKLSKAAIVAAQSNLTGLAFAHGIPGTVGGAVYMNAGAYNHAVSDVLERTTYMTPTGRVHTLERAQHHFGYRHSFFIENPRYIVLETTFVLQTGDFAQIKHEMDDYATRRRNSQPLSQSSAGSVFRRPEGHFAGTLIESCGLKGFTVGGAQVSEKHAGFIVNIGGATCKDVQTLIATIQKTVHAQTGVQLETELLTIE